MNTFKNVPEDIEQKIIELRPKEEFCNVVRLLSKEREPTKEDFLPDFVDPDSRLNRERMSSKGGMAEVVASQSDDVSDYCVSLHLLTTEVEFENFYSRMKRHKQFIAIGHTDKLKGEAYNDVDNHVMYFLYDYDTKNPHKDFTLINKADIKYGL